MTSLTLRLVEIPEAGLEIAEAAPLGWLRAVMRHTDDDAVQPVAPLEMALRVTKMKTRITVMGEIGTTVAFACSRCGKPSERQVRVTIKETFLPAEKFTLPGARTVDLEAQDFKFAYYERDELDLGAYLGESLVLELPMFPTCADPADCSGGEVAWREDWDEEAERTKDVNPAWQAQLSLVREELEEADANARDEGPAADPALSKRAKRQTR